MIFVSPSVTRDIFSWKRLSPLEGSQHFRVKADLLPLYVLFVRRNKSTKL